MYDSGVLSVVMKSVHMDGRTDVNIQ